MLHAWHCFESALKTSSHTPYHMGAHAAVPPDARLSLFCPEPCVLAVKSASSKAPLRGPAGNVEFFYELRRDGDEVDDARLDALVTEAHAP